MSRRPGPHQADLRSGAGLAAAVAGVDTVFHLASNPLRDTRQTDVLGTGRLLGIAAAEGVRNFVYISIVGIDRAPAYPYYRVKLECEQLVERSPVPWTIQRATQFFELIPYAFMPLLTRFGRFFIGRGWQMQPCAVEDVSDRLVSLAAGPGGRVADFGGPEVMTMADAARDFIRRTGSRTRVVELPIPFGFGPAFRDGALLCPDHRDGRIRWEEWLSRLEAGPTDARRG